MAQTPKPVTKWLQRHHDMAKKVDQMFETNTQGKDIDF